MLESSEAPLQIVGNINALLLMGSGAVALVLLVVLRNAAQAEGPTWGCGYIAPTVRMQYTGQSFVEMTTELLLPRWIRPRTMRQAPRGVFPSKSDFGSERPDPFSEKIYEPFFRRWAERFSRLRILQQGKVQVYLVYIVVTVVLALAWVPIRRWWDSW
jgi:hydrogenase-4 component B